MEELKQASLSLPSHNPLRIRRTLGKIFIAGELKKQKHLEKYNASCPKNGFVVNNTHKNNNKEQLCIPDLGG